MPEMLAFWTKPPGSGVHMMQEGDSKENKWRLLAVVIKQHNAAG